MRFYFQHIIILSLIVLLSSCTVGPDFTKPTIPLTSTYTPYKDINNFGYQHVKLNQAVPSTWWKEFNSSNLNEIIQQGINNNYNLISMRETLEQAKEMVNAVSGQLWPQVTLDSVAGRQKYGVALFGPSDLTIPPFSYYEIGPSLNLVPDIFVGTRRAIEKQEALANYQNYEFNALFLSLTGNIATTALSIATINKQIATVKDILIDDQKNLNLVQKAFELGSTTKTEVLSAQSQLTNDKTSLPLLYQQLSESSAELSALMGTAPANWQPPLFELHDFTLPRELPLTVPSELIHIRPDILAAESLLHAASADIGIATANLYPNINLSGATLQEALIPSNLFNASANAWSFSANLTAPIFDGGILRAKRRATIHAYNAAYANYQQVVLNAFVQVSNVLHALQHDAQELFLQKQALVTAESSLNLARLSYQAGNIGILEVLDAERFYNQARLGVIQAEAKQYQDTIQLYIVLGGGVMSPQ